MFGHVETIVLVKVYNPPNPARHTAHSFNTLDFFGQKFPSAFSHATLKRQQQLDVFTATSFTVVFWANVPINPKPDPYDISGILGGIVPLQSPQLPPVWGKISNQCWLWSLKKRCPVTDHPNPYHGL